MKTKRKQGFFSISAVAEMFSVHQQTIRLYEKQGLLNPKRSEGNTRLFSETDVERLEEIIHLTHEMGINLAGVELILKLKKQIKKMQGDMNTIFDNTQKELEKESESSKESVRQSAARLLEIKREQRRLAPPIDSAQTPVELPEMDVDNEEHWKIDYDEEDNED